MVCHLIEGKQNAPGVGLRLRNIAKKERRLNLKMLNDLIKKCSKETNISELDIKSYIKKAIKLNRELMKNGEIRKCG